MHGDFFFSLSPSSSDYNVSESGFSFWSFFFAVEALDVKMKNDCWKLNKYVYLSWQSKMCASGVGVSTKPKANLKLIIPT